MLELVAQRFSSGLESTLSLLFEHGARSPHAAPAAADDVPLRFLCFLLEDQWQAAKVASETRIPAGRYRVRIRKSGGFHERYSARFPQMHVGMLELLEVPGFTDVLIHCGNTDQNTAGCLLVGDSIEQNISGRGALGSSEAAYRRLYPQLAMAAASDAGAFITLQDFA